MEQVYGTQLHCGILYAFFIFARVTVAIYERTLLVLAFLTARIVKCPADLYRWIEIIVIIQHI